MLKRTWKNIFARTVVPYRRCCKNIQKNTLDRNTKCSYLSNGMAVVTEMYESPLTCISLFVKVGSRYETCYNNGITHFIEHMAYKGFKSLPRQILEHEVHNAGFRLNIKTERDMQIFSVVVPSESARMGQAYLYKVIGDLDFNDCAIFEEKYILCLEMMDADVNYKKTVFEFLHNSGFQGTGLGQNIIGPSSNVTKYDTNMLSKFLQENYGPEKLILCTSGCVAHEHVMENVGGTFGNLCPSPPEPDLGGTRFTCSQINYRNDDMPVAHVAIAFEAPGYSSPDYIPMLLMKYIIGSWDRTVGRADNQASYMARMAAQTCERYQSFYFAYQDVGLWGAYFVARKMDLDDMIIFLQKVWMDMTLTCTTEVLNRAAQMANLDVCMKYNGVINSSREMGIQMMYTSTRKPLNLYLDELSWISNDRVRATGLKYLYDKSPVVASIGPTEDVSEYNRIECGMYWLRW